MSRPPPTARVRPALSIQVAQLRGDDDASPGEASPGSAAGPLKRVSPRKGVSRHAPYPMSTSPLVAGESQTPGLSSKLADFSMLTPRDDGDERPVSTRTRRRGADVCAPDAAESAVIAQVERSLVAVSQRTSAVVRPPPSARSASRLHRPAGLSPRVAYAPPRREARRAAESAAAGHRPPAARSGRRRGLVPRRARRRAPPRPDPPWWVSRTLAEPSRTLAEP